MPTSIKYGPKVAFLKGSPGEISQLLQDAKEGATRENMAAEARLKKDKEANELKTLLEPIRQQYRKALVGQKRAILATVLEIITR